MLKDIKDNKVEGVRVAISEEKGTLGEKEYNAYLINENDYPLENVLIMSRGYGEVGGEKRQTSVLRKMVELLPAGSAILIEPVDPATFSLTTEFLITYYRGRAIHDARFAFEPNIMQEQGLDYIVAIDKKGISKP